MPARPSLARTILVLAAASVVAILVNALVAVVAVNLGAPSDYGPLTPPAYGLFSVLGVVAGWISWSIVTRRARSPRRTLSWLVPAVLVASFVPNVVLLATGFVPGTSITTVVALMIMHVIVAAAALPAYLYLRPVGAAERLAAVSA